MAYTVIAQRASFDCATPNNPVAHDGSRGSCGTGHGYTGHNYIGHNYPGSPDRGSPSLLVRTQSGTDVLQGAVDRVYRKGILHDRVILAPLMHMSVHMPAHMSMHTSMHKHVYAHVYIHTTLAQASPLR